MTTESAWHRVKREARQEMAAKIKETKRNKRAPGDLREARKVLKEAKHLVRLEKIKGNTATTPPPVLTEQQKSRRKAKSRKQSEIAIARKPQRKRTVRRETQRAIAKAQRILSKESK